MKNLIEIDKLIKNSWEIYKDNFWNYCSIILLPIGINFLTIVVVTISGVGGFYFWEIGDSFIFVILSIIIYFILIIAHIWGVAALIYAVMNREQKLGVFESFKKSKHLIFSFFWVGLLTALAISAGFFMLIIPGIIFAIWFQFSEYILIKDGKKGMQALNSSKKLVEGYWLSVFERIAVLFIITFLASFVFGIIPFIGSFLAAILLYPFTTIYSYLIYKNLKEIKQPAPAGIPDMQR